MTQPLYGVYGVSGFGREVMPLARNALKSLGIDPNRLVFVDDNPRTQTSNGQQVCRYNEFLSIPASARYAVIAIADSLIREELEKTFQKDDVISWTVQADNVVIMDDVEIGSGAILSPFVTLTSNIRIGRCFHANIYSYIAHDCIIGNFVTLAPSVKCNGNISIHDHAYIGTGAVIKQGTQDKPIVIGRQAIVGMGAVVTKSVPPGATVVGNPARIFEK